MKRWTYSLVALALVVGAALGYGGSRLQTQRANYAQLNEQLGSLSSALGAAQQDLRQVRRKNTPGLTAAQKRYNAKLHKGYQAEYVASIGQADLLWGALSNQLVQEGFSSLDVQTVGVGLDTVYYNIFMSIQPTPQATQQRAEAWVTMLARSVEFQPTKSDKTPDYVKMLKSHIHAIAEKYLSYKSDPNFETSVLVPPNTSNAASEFLQQKPGQRP